MNIPGLQMAHESRKAAWMQAEGEIGCRTLDAAGEDVEPLLYVDLPSRHIAFEYARRSQRLWKDVSAICRETVREFPRIRAERPRSPAVGRHKSPLRSMLPGF